MSMYIDPRNLTHV